MKCHQKIIRDKEAANAQFSLFPNYWDNLDLSRQKAEIMPVDYETAKSIILRYEWLGTMPNPFRYGYGLFLDGNLAGVECFTDQKPGSVYTFENEPAICLARGACVHWAPDWANSYLISGCLKFLPDKYRWVIAYSDTDAGEIGTIYQACNWFCVGAIPNRNWIGPNGQKKDREYPRTVAKWGRIGYAKNSNPEKVRSDMIAAGWTYQTGGKRYKYVYPLSKNKQERKRMKKRLEAISIPYPKRQKKMKKSLDIPEKFCNLPTDSPLKRYQE